MFDSLRVYPPPEENSHWKYTARVNNDVNTIAKTWQIFATAPLLATIFKGRAVWERSGECRLVLVSASMS